MKDILVCLEAMNRIGLAHRDIKPANILMCKDGASPKIKVADFGMATFIGEDGRVRGRCGTPGYVAPEIFAAGVNGGYSSKVDVFSAGVVLYVMLCGYEPFYGETDAELVQANREASVDFPADEWKHISSGARDLVQKMMEANPEKRLTSKEALRHSWFQLIHIDDVDLLDEGLASQALHDINNCIIS
jgi:serine/threonine protein kinase